MGNNFKVKDYEVFHLVYKKDEWSFRTIKNERLDKDGMEETLKGKEIDQ
jgi:hypothetical protein